MKKSVRIPAAVLLIVIVLVTSSCDRLTALFMQDLYSNIDDAQTNGTGILVAGAFASVNGTVQGNLARVDSTGQLVGGFSPLVVGGTVNTVALVERSGETVALFGGAFTEVNGQVVPGLAIVDLNGDLVTAFAPDLDPVGGTTEILKVLPTGSGTVLVAGEFGGVGGNGDYAYLAELNLSNGSAVSSFTPSPDGVVRDLVTGLDDETLPDRYIVVGSFSQIGGVPSRYAAAIGTDGSTITVLESIDPSANLGTIAVSRRNDRYLVGGIVSPTIPDFYTSVTEGAGLLSTGEYGIVFVAETELPQPDGEVFALSAIDAGGYLVGGSFTVVRTPSGSERQSYYLFAVDEYGSLRSSFIPTLDGVVAAIQPAGTNVYVAGSFTTFSTFGDPELVTTHVARLQENLTPDPSFLVVLDAAAGTTPIVRDMAMIADFE